MRVALAVSSLSLILAAAPSPMRAQTSQLPSDVPAAASASYRQALDYEQRQQLGSALDGYKAALKQAGSCSSCLEAIERVEFKMDHYKDAAGTAEKMAAAAPDPQHKAAAEMLAGAALYRQSFAYTEGEGEFDRSPKRAADSLKQAEAVLAKGVADDSGNEPLRLLHARVLAALHHDEDASREFTACASVPGASAAECTRALRLAADVPSAREEPAPAFQLQTLDGQTVSLNSLAGKVVLVDFWATWCSACRSDSSYVQSMLDSFHDGRFVLLEVDIDKSHDLWKNFVAEERLQGTQTQDVDGSMQTLFHVSAFPTYVIIDGNGTMRLRARGIEGDLRGAIRKLLAEQSAAAQTNPVRKPLGAGGD